MNILITEKEFQEHRKSQQELDKYKAKEKELREYFEEHNLFDEDSYSCEEIFAYYQFKDILDILDKEE